MARAGDSDLLALSRKLAYAALDHAFIQADALQASPHIYVYGHQMLLQSNGESGQAALSAIRRCTSPPGQPCSAACAERASHHDSQASRCCSSAATKSGWSDIGLCRPER